VAPEDLAHIFDRFYRPGRHAACRGPVGLAIVAQAVRTDGGSVAVRNRESGGAEFEISLPVLDVDGGARTLRAGPPSRGDRRRS